MADPRTQDRLAIAVRRVLGQRERRAPAPSDMHARLDALERDMQEVRTRVNALFFAVISVALGDLLARAVLA